MNEPIHIISLGAGVQSSTMALMAAAGEITPMPVAAIFADTQAEPKSVYTWLDWLEKQLPFPVVRVSHGSLWENATRIYAASSGTKITAQSIPAFVLNPDGTQGLMSRQCTSDFKVYPVSKEITKWMKLSKTRRAVKWLGISLDEISRVKDSRRNSVQNRYPLIDFRMHRHDCLVWMEKHGFPKPPRSACVFCPYRSNEEWRALSKDEFQDAVRFEKELQSALTNVSSMNGKPWLHRSMKPLSEVDLSTEEDRGQLSLFNNDCEGHCGV